MIFYRRKVLDFYLETCEAFLTASGSRWLKMRSSRFESSRGFRFMMISWLVTSGWSDQDRIKLSSSLLLLLLDLTLVFSSFGYFGVNVVMGNRLDCVTMPGQVRVLSYKLEAHALWVSGHARCISRQAAELNTRVGLELIWPSQVKLDIFFFLLIWDIKLNLNVYYFAKL